MAASTAGFVASIVVSYALQRCWVFRSTQRHVWAGLNFLTVTAVAFGVNTGILWIGTEVLHGAVPGGPGGRAGADTDGELHAERAVDVQELSQHRRDPLARRGRPRAAAGPDAGRPAARRDPTSSARLSRVTSRFVPCVMVTGRSVLGRRVRHGTPRTVVSSCTPPESVITAAAPADQAEELDVAERVDDADPRVVEEAGRVQARPGRAGAAAAPPRPGRRTACRAVTSCRGVVRIGPRWPDGAGWRPRTGRRGRARPGRRDVEAVEVGQQGVDHRVADQVDPLRVHALVAEVGDGVRRWSRRAGRRAGR